MAILVAKRGVTGGKEAQRGIDTAKVSADAAFVGQLAPALLPSEKELPSGGSTRLVWPSDHPALPYGAGIRAHEAREREAQWQRSLQPAYQSWRPHQPRRRLPVA